MTLSSFYFHHVSRPLHLPPVVHDFTQPSWGLFLGPSAQGSHPRFSGSFCLIKASRGRDGRAPGVCNGGIHHPEVYQKSFSIFPRFYHIFCTPVTPHHHFLASPVILFHHTQHSVLHFGHNHSSIVGPQLPRTIPRPHSVTIFTNILKLRVHSTHPALDLISSQCYTAGIHFGPTWL